MQRHQQFTDTKYKHNVTVPVSLRYNIYKGFILRKKGGNLNKVFIFTLFFRNPDQFLKPNNQTYVNKGNPPLPMAGAPTSVVAPKGVATPPDMLPPGIPQSQDEPSIIRAPTSSAGVPPLTPVMGAPHSVPGNVPPTGDQAPGGYISVAAAAGQGGSQPSVHPSPTAPGDGSHGNRGNICRDF